jgi:hypothetical protein
MDNLHPAQTGGSYDENISNAMSQIGVQLSSRLDALTALLDLTEGYAKHVAKP